MVQYRVRQPSGPFRFEPTNTPVELSNTPFGPTNTPFGLANTPFGLSLSKPCMSLNDWQLGFGIVAGLRQFLNSFPVPSNQGFLFRPRPTLDLLFERNSAYARLELAMPHQFDRITR